MEFLDILGSLIAAGIWFFIGILSVLAVPVAFLIALLVFPFWWIGDHILRKVNHG